MPKVIAVILVVAIVFAGASFSICGPLQQTKNAVGVQADQQPKSTAEDQTKGAQSALQSSKNLSTIHNLEEAHRDKRTDHVGSESTQPGTEYWPTVWGIKLKITDSLLALFTGFLILIGVWQGYQLRRSVDAVHAGERAYVFPGNPKAFVRPTGAHLLYYKTSDPSNRGPKPTIVFNFVNYGRSPAIILNVRAAMELIRKEPPKFPRFEHSILWDGETLLAKDSPSNNMTFEFHRNITPEELDLINAGEITPFFYGWVQYRDMFGFLHQRGWGNVFTEKSLDGVTQIGGRAFNYSRSKRWKEPKTPLWVVLFIRPLWAVLRHLPPNRKPLESNDA